MGGRGGGGGDMMVGKGMQEKWKRLGPGRDSRDPAVLCCQNELLGGGGGLKGLRGNGPGVLGKGEGLLGWRRRLKSHQRDQKAVLCSAE